MSKSQRLTTRDAARTIRIAWEAAELFRQPAEQGRHIVDRLCTLVGADFGFWCVIDHFLPSEIPRFRFAAAGSAQPEELLEYFARSGIDFPSLDDPAVDLGRYVADREVLPMVGLLRRADPATHSASIDIMKRMRTRDALIGIARRADTPDAVNALSVHRTSIARVHDSRERQLTTLLLDELQYLHSTGRLERSAPSAFADLPPRQRQVAELLLTAASQKEIASRMRLSTHTLRDYVKAIYRTFGIGSRPEFMVRFGSSAS